jgi:hypothetical protein
MTGWLDAALAVPLVQVAGLLGLEEGKPSGGRQTWSCPACGDVTRHHKSKDRRGAVGLSPSLSGWACHQCGARGDAVDLVAFAVAGHRLRDLAGDDLERVRLWFEDLGAGGPPEPRARRPRPAPAPAAYPPGPTVEALWAQGRPVDGDADVAAYLTGRGLDPARVAELDLARALRPGAALPGWAMGPNGSWLATGHRLLVPLVDSRGALRSVLVRAVTSATPKSLAPARHERRGLVMADGLGRQLLEVGARPAWFDDDVRLVVRIDEGEIDFLTDATAPEAMADSGHGPAVIGAVEGAWLSAHADRIPDGARVVVGTDRDDAGDSYAARIAATFGDRDVELRRGRPGREWVAP